MKSCHFRCEIQSIKSAARKINKSQSNHLVHLFVLLCDTTVDGCDTSPLANNRLNGSLIRSSSAIGGGNSLRSPPTTSPPTTTLLQNILQQSRNGVNGSNGSPNGHPNQGSANGATNTSPLPPSPADSGVSDVDSHYSSNDEQQQLSQYSYFYSQAHRSTCEYLVRFSLFASTEFRRCTLRLSPYGEMIQLTRNICLFFFALPLLQLVTLCALSQGSWHVPVIESVCYTHHMGNYSPCHQGYTMTFASLLPHLLSMWGCIEWSIISTDSLHNLAEYHSVHLCNCALVLSPSSLSDSSRWCACLAVSFSIIKR